MKKNTQFFCYAYKKSASKRNNQRMISLDKEGSVIIPMSLISQKKSPKQEENKALLKPYFVSSYGDFPCLYDEYAAHNKKSC